MAEPWDEKTDDQRESDNIENFIIFFEDQVIEPHYFISFGVAGKVKINDVPNQLQGTRHLQNAITTCVRNGLMEYSHGRYIFPKHITENIWCVFDRDVESPNPDEVRLRDDIDFTSAIQFAEDSGFRVAWSNDIFELWLLLHFEDVEPGVAQHRTQIYERLTNILRAMPGQSPEFQNLVNHHLFNYKETMKNKVRFATMVMPLLKGKTLAAEQRAILLEVAFTSHIPPHQQNPCTKVHHLVRELLNAGA